MKIKASRLLDTEAVFYGKRIGKIQQPGIIDDPKIESRIHYKLTRISKELKREADILRDEMRKIYKKYSELDKKGNIKLDDKGNIIFKKDKNKECVKEINDFLDNLEVKIDCWKISQEELSKIEITGRKIIVIDWLIEEPIGKERGKK